MIRRRIFLSATSALILARGFLMTVATPVKGAAADNALDARLRAIAGAGMVGSHTFDYLTQLSDEVGARVTGSPEAAHAVEWGLATMRAIGLENVHAEHWQLWRGWTRGSAEAWLIAPTRRKLLVDSMGWVGSTSAGGVDADVVEVNIADMANEMAHNSGNWAGKILVVVRKPVANQRPAAAGGASDFASFGKFLEKAFQIHAVAVIGGQGGAKAAGIKLTHTGILGFETYFDIPVVSMAAEDQNQVERMLDAGKLVKLHINVQNTVTAGPVDSANVVGEIRGTEHPEQIVVVGGHLDSWDLAQGSTDDGCGVATTLGAAEAIVRSGMKPKRTIRFVLFTGEEQGLLGSFAYAKQHQSEMANHLGDVILDSGQGAVVGFDLNGRDDLAEAMKPLANSLAAFGAMKITSALEFGTDTGAFTLAGLPGIDLSQAPSDYNISHHSPADTLDRVDPAILTRNATIQALVSFWIADQPERFASPWSAQKTEKMLKDNHMEEELKEFGIWPFGSH